VHKKRIQEQGEKEKPSIHFYAMQLNDICKTKVQKEVELFCFLLPSTMLTFKGLEIQEATYAPMDKSDWNHELNLDVTIPLQALVRSSQLHIPGDQPKVRYS
jgi:hypothetical protein